MEKLKRGDRIYLDNKTLRTSKVNSYLNCVGAVVEVYEYNDCSGHGDAVRLFLCTSTKHEVVSIIRQTFDTSNKYWEEEEIAFDSDSLVFLKALLNQKHNELGGIYTSVRDC